jgi:hypothetical protein
MVAARFIKAHAKDEQMYLALDVIRELIEPGEEPVNRTTRRWQPADQIGKRGNWNVDYLVWKRLMLLRHPLLEPDHGGCRPGQKRPMRRRPPVAPEEVLREVLAIFLLNEMHPEFLKDDSKPLSVQVARSVFKLRPSGRSNTNSKIPSYTACVAFGERVRNSSVWLFMMKNLETIKAEDRARVERKQKMYEPMTPKIKPRPQSQRLLPEPQKPRPILQPQPVDPTSPEPRSNISEMWREHLRKGT